MKKKYNLILLCFLILFSCKKDGLEGPNLNDLYGELNFENALAIVGDSASFSQNEDVYFTAKFSKIVDWKITITGLNSMSKKQVTLLLLIDFINGILSPCSFRRYAFL